LAKTPFGQFLSPGMADGTPVDIVVRPQHIKIDFDRNGKGPDPTAVDGVAACGIVERARFMGRESLVEFRLYDSAEVLRVTVPNVFLPNVGQRLWLTVPRKRCFIFPQKA
jgi:iron(III) transport system ATP-binding protein